MLKITCEGVYYKNGGFVPAKDGPAAGLPAPEKAREGTMAHAILKAHNTGDNMEELAIRFDAMASHDITYVGIIQTARASGMQAFPLPYVLTNCHNSLCAVGGTINEDDHVFGLSAAKKYGGEFVPAHQSVIHSYMRERYASGRGQAPPLHPSIRPSPVGAALVAARLPCRGRCPHRPAPASLLAFQSACIALFSILFVFYPFYITIWS